MPASVSRDFSEQVCTRERKISDHVKQFVSRTFVLKTKFVFNRPNVVENDNVLIRDAFANSKLF